jgi:hypothetical protein
LKTVNSGTIQGKFTEFQSKEEAKTRSKNKNKQQHQNKRTKEKAHRGLTI